MEKEKINVPLISQQHLQKNLKLYQKARASKTFITFFSCILIFLAFCSPVLATTISDKTSIFSGNITPSANNTHSLGTPDLRFSDVWVSNSSIHLGDITLTEDGGCLRTTDFHAHGSGDVAGFFKMKQGTTPADHAEENHSLLWVDSSENLYFEQSNGTEILLTGISGGGSNVSGGGAFYGSLKWEADTDCAMGTSGGFTSPTAFTADTDCDDKVRTTMGLTTSNTSIGSVEGRQPKIKFDSLPAGYYNVILLGNFRATATDVDCNYMVTIDSGEINSSLSGMTATAGSAGMSPIVSGLLYVPTDRGETTIELYGGESAPNCRIQITSTELEISVYYLPSFGEAKNDTIFSDLDGDTRINVDGNGNNSNNITFTNNGTETLIVDSNGNVGITMGNITTSNYGFFGWLGSLTNRITKLWIGEINATGNIVTEENMSATYFIGDGSQLTGVGTVIISESTGLIQGGAVSVNVGDNTLIDISEGSGQIVDSTSDPDNPVLTPISWENKTGYNLTTAADPGDVIAVYLSLDSGGNVVERLSLPTPEERRNTIDLGIAARFEESTIVFAGSGPTNVVHNPSSQLQDLMDALGPFNVDGNRIQPYNSNSLQFNKTEGTVFRNGVNFQTDGKNPHMISLSERAPVDQFNYKLGDGTDVNLSSSQLDPDNYDDGTSTLATVPDNKWTIQYVTIFATGVIEVLYGQEIFDIEQDAIIAISNIDFIIPNDSREAVPLSYVILQQGDTSLPTERFYRISRGGKAGGNVATTFLGLLNLQTGWLSGGSFSFPEGKNLGMEETYFMIANQSDGNAITVEKYTFPANASIPTGIGMNEELWVTLYAPGGVPTIKFFTLTEYDSDFSNIIRNYAVIGRIWSNGTGDLTGGKNYVIKSYGSYGLLYDLFDILGPAHNKEGNNFYSTGENKLGKYIGKSMRLNARAATDADSSSIGVDPAVVNFTDIYYFVKNDSISYTLYGDIQSNQWYNPDTNAVETMSANKWTTQLICFWPVSQLPTAHYGWKEYGTLEEAKAARHDDYYENIGNTGTVCRSWLFIKEGASTLEEKLVAEEAEFLAMPDLYFGSGGGAGGGGTVYTAETGLELTGTEFSLNTTYTDDRYLNSGNDTGNFNLSGNFTASNITAIDYGFFNWLGSISNRITTLFVQDINISGNITGADCIVFASGGKICDSP